MAYRNRLVTTISAVAAAGLGAFTVGPAQSGYATFSAGDNGLTFDVSVVEGTAWEVRTGCVYTHSGTTLSRGTLESSSTGSAIAFTAAAVLTVTMAASTGDAIKALVSGEGKLGTLVTDWATNGSAAVTGSAGATVATDPSVLCAGYPMLKITIGAVGVLIMTFTFTTAITFAQLKTMQFPVRWSRNASGDGSTQNFGSPTLWIVGTGGGQWRYGVATSGFRDSATLTRSVAPGNATQGWAFSGTGPPTSTTSMDADTIASIKFVYAVNSQDAGEAFWLGPIFSGARRRGVVSVVMDGQYSSQSNFVLPMLRAQGLRATLFLQNSLVGSGGRMSWADISRHYSDGHDMSTWGYDGSKSGGYVNATDWPTGAAITADQAASFADLTSRGYTRGVGFSTWGGSALPYTYTVGKTRQDLVTGAIVAAGTRALLCGSVPNGSYERLQSIAHDDLLDPMFVQGAIQITNTDSATTITSIIDRARDRGEWAIIKIHRSAVSAPASLEMLNSDFDTWISYLGAEVGKGAVECIPFGEAFDKFGA